MISDLAGHREPVARAFLPRVVARSRNGEPVCQHARLATNALQWTAGPDGVTYRLETALDLEAAVRLAATLH